tara:strand:- start:258 stop:551 length:294 start_codon:yes stop_codon:yes gene_type:complete
MKINKDKVKKIAKLARLSLEDKDIDSMVSDLKNMLTFVNKLNELNTEDVAPLTHVHPDTNILREDRSTSLKIKTKILSNAPNHNSDYIKVPKVLRKK